MADRCGNPDSEIQSIITQHGVFAFVIGTLISQMQVKYQPMDISPFDSHHFIMLMFLVALLIYATSSVAEIKLRAPDSNYHLIAGYIRLLASSHATVLLLLIIYPILGSITSILWACFFVKAAYDLYQAFDKLLCDGIVKVQDMLKKLVEIVRFHKVQAMLKKLVEIVSEISQDRGAN